jgi:hypothetical protein
MCAGGDEPSAALLCWAMEETGAGGDMLGLDPLSMPTQRSE